MRITAMARAALVTTAAVVTLTATITAPAQATDWAATGGMHREAGQTVTVSLYDAIDNLTVANEDRTGYVRTAFRHWVDADKDGCDARKEVILAEAEVQPMVGPKCALAGGLWTSRYDNLTITEASKIDVDHMVPLAEAWDSK